MSTSLDKPRLLLIDDEPLVIGMIARLLRPRYDVVATTEGVEGLRLAGEGEWGAILCDVMLPDLSGPELLRRLRVTNPAMASKLGFMTGGAFGAEAIELEECNPGEGWLAKPFSLAELEAFVAGILARTHDDT